MTLYSLVVIGHVFLVIVALGAHGAAALAMFEVRRESDRARLAAILDLSSRSFPVAGSALLGAIVLGVVAMVMGNWVGRLWVWASIAILVAVILLMTPLAGRPMLRVRRALGLRSDREGPGFDPTLEPLSDDELIAARAALRPGMAALVGLVGTLLLVWLMEAKPF